MLLPPFLWVLSASPPFIPKKLLVRLFWAGCLVLGSLFGHTLEGAVTVERWEDIRGNNVLDLMQISGYPHSPDSIGVIDSFCTPRSGDFYGQRLRAVLTVSQSGHRVFRIAGDNQCRLLLSGDSGPYLNKSLIASVPGRTKPGQWNRYRTQISSPVYLKAGVERYLEVLHKEGRGGDHVTVQWAPYDPETKQTGKFSLIPGNLLTAYVEETGAAQLPSNGVLISRWHGIRRGALKGLINYPRFPHAPNEFIALETLDSPSFGQNYGQRIEGLLTPTESAYRVFRIAGDDECKLSLSNGPSKFDGRTVIASVFPWAQPNQWNRYRTQTSAPVYLEANTGRYLEVLHKQGGGRDHFTVQWAPYDPATGQTGEFSLIPNELLTPYAGEATDQDHDDLPDKWERIHGFDPEDPAQSGEFSRLADPDSDLLSNAEESLLGTDPFAFNQQAGHFVHDIWNQAYHYSVEDLRKSDAFYGEPSKRTLTAIDQVHDYSSYSGHRLRAHFTPSSSGPHRFWLSTRTSAQLWISEDDTPFRKRLYAQLSPNLGTGHGVHYRSRNRWDVFASQRSGEVKLQSGRKYLVEIIAQHGHGGFPHVSLAWTPPGGEREPVPADLFGTLPPPDDDLDDDSLPDSWESVHGLSLTDNGLEDRAREGEFGDFDLDGLLNRDEYMLGTDPSSADTDGDGLSDGDEIHSFRTDPMLSDSKSELLVCDLDLEQALNIDKGLGWNLTSRGLVPTAFRGEFALNFDLGQAGFHVIEIQTSLVGDLSLHKQLKAEVLVNGIFLGGFGLTYTSNRKHSIRAVTPYLPAGRHQMRVRIRNMFLSQSFSVDSVRVLRPEGGDLDGDGQPDWIVNLLREHNKLCSAPARSRVSPAFLEGRARDFSFVTFNGEKVAPGRDPTHWYVNLPLEIDASAGGTPYEVGFEQSLVQTGSIAWARTDPFALAGTTLLVRRGDSIILTGEANGTLELPDGQVHAFVQNGERIFTFEQSGQHLIRATRPGEEAILKVEVLQANFSSTTLDFVQNKSLSVRFHRSKVSPSLFFESGPGIRFENPGFVRGNHLHLRAHPSERGPARLLARISAEGPVAGVKELNVIAISDATQNGPSSSYRLDGLSSHYVMENPIVVDDFPEGGRIEMIIFRHGVTFLDGTQKKTLFHDDFVNGVNTVSFLIPNGMRGGFCHRIRIFDRNGRLIANR
jgi:hypothetical protein